MFRLPTPVVRGAGALSRPLAVKEVPDVGSGCERSPAMPLTNSESLPGDEAVCLAAFQRIEQRARVRRVRRASQRDIDEDVSVD